MNLPYAIVITTYPGASPETVETVVTRPVEQSMATVTDIENVSSQSSENMSMVTLEFEELHGYGFCFYRNPGKTGSDQRLLG